VDLGFLGFSGVIWLGFAGFAGLVCGWGLRGLRSWCDYWGGVIFAVLGCLLWWYIVCVLVVIRVGGGCYFAVLVWLCVLGY